MKNKYLRDAFSNEAPQVSFVPITLSCKTIFFEVVGLKRMVTKIPTKKCLNVYRPTLRLIQQNTGWRGEVTLLPNLKNLPSLSSGIVILSKLLHLVQKLVTDNHFSLAHCFTFTVITELFNKSELNSPFRATSMWFKPVSRNLSCVRYEELLKSIK